MRIKRKDNRSINIKWNKWKFGRYKYYTVTQYYIGWIIITIDNKIAD